MKRSITRLCESLGRLLAPEAFIPVPGGTFAYGRVFARPAEFSGLYERVEVHFAGHQQEAAVADISVSTTRCAYGECEKVHLTEAAQDDLERSLTLISDSKKARDWERRVAAVAPGRCRELAKLHGANILERTRSARAAAEKYLLHLNVDEKPEYQLEPLRRQATLVQMTEATRLAEAPGVLSVVGEDTIFEVACLCIVLFSHQVESTNRFAGGNALEDQELMWRIQLVADELLVRHSTNW